MIITTSPLQSQLQQCAYIENVDRISANDIVIYIDGWDFDYLLENFNSKGYPRAVISDCFKSYHNPLACNIVGCHTVAARFLQDYRALSFSDDLTTTHAANVFFNKKQVSRFLSLKLAEIFNISFDYFWSGIGRYANLSKILDEIQSLDQNILDSNQKAVLLSPIHFSKKWFNNSYDDQDPDSVDPDIVDLRHGVDTVQSWQQFFAPMMSNTAVSLINENPDFTKVSLMTWKTFFPVMALTFPIWVGGYRIAEEFSNAGFDAFDDVIDHSYQYKQTLFERCWYAFENNKHLLTDVKLAAQTRNRYRARLLKNRQKFLSGQLYQHILSEVRSWNHCDDATKNLYISEFLLNCRASI
jgi:hypothetical protein